MPKGRIIRNVQASKSCIWLKKNEVVSILQYIAGYYLVLYKDFQLLIRETDLELIQNA